jgi:hypothetical protein
MLTSATHIDHHSIYIGNLVVNFTRHRPLSFDHVYVIKRANLQQNKKLTPTQI